MSKYNPNEIEKKWQEKWAADQVYIHKDQPEKEKYYMLDMFPYPSGDGLHMGHTESYTASDIIYRYKRHKGYDVLHPQGFDSFGLPAENYAIKTGVHPAETTEENAATYIKQMKMLGLGHDLENMVYTSRPDYYKWTQFLFGKFFEGGLLERKTDTINWCPSCNTGIANEQVEDGRCERCKTEIEQRQIPSWNMKITDFADELVDDLDKVDWPEHTKKNQRNWIGRSYGAKLNFLVIASGAKQSDDNQALEVFTTRPDTLFGATYMVIAPEHNLIENYKLKIENFDEVSAYVQKAKNKTEMERQENKEKTGVEIKGVKAINPATKEEIQIFVADYVLSGYGTGAIMAVPAHDERDYEFAKKYGLEIREVISRETGTPNGNEVEKRGGCAVVFDPKRQKYGVAKRGDGVVGLFSGGAKDGESRFQAVIREVEEESGLYNFSHIEKVGNTYTHYYNSNKKQRVCGLALCNLMILENDDKKPLQLEEHENFDLAWMSPEEILENWEKNSHKDGSRDHWRYFLKQAVSRAVELGYDKVSDAKIYDGSKYIHTGSGRIVRGASNVSVISTKTIKVLEALKEISLKAEERDIDFWLLGGLAIAFYSGELYRDHSDLDLIAKNDDDYNAFVSLLEELGYKKGEEKHVNKTLDNYIFTKDDIEIDIGRYVDKDYLPEEYFTNDTYELFGVKTKILSPVFLKKMKKEQLIKRNEAKDELDFKMLLRDESLLQKYVGMDSEKAKQKLTEYVGGEMTKNFRLRDWSISRQRYWGAPIPVVYSPEGKAKYVGDENLPWLLPDDVDFVPTGESPLAKSKELKERTETLFGKGWRPEVDTMDTFVCSSWYFLRYPDAKNDQEFCAKEKLKRWLPVDMYIGGPEHTYMHLLYARFWVKAMHRLGMIDFDEPFKKLRHQGMVLDKNGVKMSKSKGNVVNPNDMVEKFGADATRLYMMFAGPLEDDVMWNEEGVKGVYRFLEKVWRVFNEAELIDCEGDCEEVDRSIPTLYHKTVKKVTEDIESLSLNTAVSQMMIFINEALKQQKLPKPAMKNFLIILNPFAPHITEELWSDLGETDLILDQAWPSWNENMIKDDTIKIAIQVNGKVRDTLEVDADTGEEEIKRLAQDSEKVGKWIEDKKLKKIIYVKGKLVSIVV